MSGKHRTLIGIVATVAVVALVVIGISLYRAGQSSSNSSSDAYNTTLDNVVAGDGATRQSANVPSVGVSYPDTCIGAAQAAAGWSSQVFGIEQAAAGVDPAAFSDLVLEEIMTTDAVIQDGDPVDSTAAAADKVAEASENNQPLPTDTAEFDEGGYKLETCTEGQTAEVTIIGNVSTNGWTYDTQTGTASTTSPSSELIIHAYTYHLVSRDGYWRVQQLEDAQDELGALSNFGDAWIDANGEMTDSVRDALKSDLGAGGHLYVERS